MIKMSEKEMLNIKAKISKHNASGCMDLTAYEVMQNIERTKKFNPTEAQEQKKLFEWVSWNTKRFSDLESFYHIPNGGSRNKAEAYNLKLQGVRAGVPDLFLSVGRHGYYGMYIELKHIGGRVSKEQGEWINRVRKNGYAAYVCYGADEAIEKLEWYLKGGDTID